MSEYPYTCNFCGVPYRVDSADEGTCSPDSEYHAIKTELAQKDAQIRGLVDKIEAFKKFASHRPGQEVEFFRYMFRRETNPQFRSSVDAVWGTVADALEAVSSLPSDLLKRYQLERMLVAAAQYLYDWRRCRVQRSGADPFERFDSAVEALNEFEGK